MEILEVNWRLYSHHQHFEIHNFKTLKSYNFFFADKSSVKITTEMRKGLIYTTRW